MDYFCVPYSRILLILSELHAMLSLNFLKCTKPVLTWHVHTAETLTDFVISEE
uniref:Uncharacterized protein n=1 Tax=Manihot esculenta TaxID=3983 RepID=A0A2C9VHB8_MANES